eukprot:CCRYP_014869-RA/>CCRYP_014869-RA protein AED:0.13 eAED:0.13 QI:0/0/0/1/1/1/2/0/518
MTWSPFILALSSMPLAIHSFHLPTMSGVVGAGVTSIAHPIRRSMRESSCHEGQKNDKPTSEEVDYGLYVHIPFCRRRCNYCDFAIVPIGTKNAVQSNGDGGTSPGFQKMNQEYTNAVLTEISMIASSSHPNKIPLRSIYFGGGTPSLAPLSTLSEIMQAIFKSDNSPFRLKQDAEVTIEMDPGTFDLKALTAVKEMGFNRISLGVQSLDDAILTSLGRVHRSSDVYQSIELIRQVYGEEANYSIDLISGVPGLTLAGWTETLSQVVRLYPRPLHISLYDLQVEKGTAFGKWYDNGNTRDDDLVITTASNTTNVIQPCHLLKNAPGCIVMRNYEHYEISSYAYRDSNSGETHRSKHNQIYWEMNSQWYAIGLGATSNLNGVRFARPRALSDYVSWTNDLNQMRTRSQNNVAHSSWEPWLLPSAESDEDATEDDMLLDIIMTRLRTSDGLDLDWIANHSKSGNSRVEAILRGFKLALELDLGERIILPGRKFGFIRLRDPNGFLFSNNIISNIFMETECI